MPEWALILLAIAAYVVITRWVFPRFGIST
jgi:hypothetical protein